MTYTLLDLAESFIGYHELPGSPAEPLIVAMLQSVEHDIVSDEVAWCSAAVNWWAARFANLSVPRSRSLAARSWLAVGTPVTLRDAKAGWDVVIFKRGQEPQPGPEVTSGAPGHVAVYVGQGAGFVTVCGGNQGNKVCIENFPAAAVLGVRRLYMEPAAGL